MIPERFTYFFVDFFTIIFPFIFSNTKAFNFKDYWKFFFPANLIVAIIYILWDMLYTYIGVWGFNEHYTLGFSIFNLPIEEILFFICTPYACLFTYYCFKKYIFSKIKKDWNLGWILFAFWFFTLGVKSYHYLYTSAAFISSSIAFIVAYRFRRIQFSHFLIFYLAILVPFFIFNGILTGSFLERIVVYYNNSENLNIRLLTIPFEDIFYGMAMLLFNIIGFEYMIKRNEK